ncbi:MAG TPA: PIG-L family deacetylase, partial [Vicinamibacteria bacterium]|nr:PIG-L family deacetylase [Vicinamibacteria bacterium]
MGVPALAPLHGRYDCLFVSPHADDVLVSCAGRLRFERDRGSTCLLLALFEPAEGSEEAGAGLRELGVEYLAAGLPAARRRLADDAPFGEVGFGRRPEDEDWLAQATRLLGELGPRIRPRHVYAPLGVGGHIDHRLSHEAALRAFGSEAGRNVYLYEDRPEAFVPGAVRVRLGVLGARLPPAAAAAPERAGLARYLLSFHVPPALRGDLRGWADRVRSAGAAAREWRLARTWNPQRAFGPRLQPLVHAVEDGLGLVEAAATALVPAGARGRERMRRRFAAMAAGYARRL